MSIETIDQFVERVPTARKFIQNMVRDEHFDDVKDFFMENVPGGESGQEKDAVLCHGKYLGIRFLFKELVRIARQKPTSSDKQKPGTQARDPDLDER